MATSSQLPRNVEEQLQGFEEAVTRLEHAMEPLLSSSPSELEAGMSKLERAELHATLAHSAATSFALLLKAQGVTLDEHSAKKEIDRVNKYVKKVKQAQESEAAASQPRMRLEKDAAQRLTAAATASASRHTTGGDDTANEDASPEENNKDKYANETDHEPMQEYLTLAGVSQPSQSSDAKDEQKRRKKKQKRSSGGTES